MRYCGLTGTYLGRGSTNYPFSLGEEGIIKKPQNDSQFHKTTFLGNREESNPCSLGGGFWTFSNVWVLIAPRKALCNMCVCVPHRCHRRGLGTMCSWYYLR